MKIFSDGAMPLLASVYDQLSISDKINEIVKWDEEKCKLTPGQIVKALILNMLTDRKPLSRISEFYKDKDVEKLIGNGIVYSDINEWCIGRTLEKIFEADAKKVYSLIAATAVGVEKIDVKSLHWDTTSKSLQGEYNAVKMPEETKVPIEIIRGYSKDLRADLKQIKFGLGVTKDKIPIYADVLSGNKDDKTWNGDIIKTIAEIISFLPFENIIHVADSALVTTDNLLSIPDEKYKFISRLPANFKLEQELKQRAVNKDENWIDLGQLTDKDKAAHYKMQVFTADLVGKTYRFAVCHSDHLDERKLKTIDSNIKKELSYFAKQIKGAEQPQGYYCEADAQAAAEKIIEKNKAVYHGVKYKIVEDQRNKKTNQRGRPSKDAIREIETFYTITWEITQHEENIRKAKEEAGIFILITNEKDKGKLNDSEILTEYKNQNSVESTFRILKDPQYVEEIFLKKPKRIEAFGYIMVMGVLLMNLIERRIRKNLEKEDEPIALQGRRYTLTPTATAILQVFEYAKVVAIQTDEGIQRIMPEPLTENQKRILRLCGVDENIYVNNSNSNLNKGE